MLIKQCATSVFREPVEETDTQKPSLEDLRLEFDGRSFEYEITFNSKATGETETGRHPDGGSLRLTKDDDHEEARLSFPLSNGG